MTAQAAAAPAATKKEKKQLSMWAVVLIIIAVVYVLSFIIPSGSYDRTADGTVIPDSYHTIEKVIMMPWDVILGIGSTAASSFGTLFISILVMGGLMGIVNSTKALDRCLARLVARLKDKSLLIIPVFIFAMGFFGCLGSMISTAILFIPLGLSLAKRLKCTRSFAVCLILLGSYTGFMSSPVNTLTTILGQGLAGLTPYSGAGLRTVVTIINLAVVSGYLMWLAARQRRNPTLSEADFADDEGVDDSVLESEPLRGNEVAMLCLFFGSFLFFAIGGPIFGFNVAALGSIMLPVALVCGLLAGYDLNTMMSHFVKGSQGMVTIIVFMILASTMSVILNGSMILDSVVYYLSLPLSSLNSSFASIGMFVANAIIDNFIGSGSAHTTIVMPIMAPLADVVGVTRQMALLALQYGDGFTNLLSPASTNLLACLALAGVSLKQWYKSVIPVYAMMFVVLCVSIFVGTAIGYC